jgi:putative transposon-encoded protein
MRCSLYVFKFRTYLRFLPQRFAFCHSNFKHLYLTMRKLTIEKGNFHLDDEIEEVVEVVVKKIGNRAMIISTKKYIGRKVYVLIRK